MTQPEEEVLSRAGFQRYRRDVLWFAILVGMAIAVRVPLGHVADPTDTSFIPRPEWYFLFLFQMLKLFEGPLEIVGSLILPTLAILALFLVPFIDRGKMVRDPPADGRDCAGRARGPRMGGLTARAVATTPPSTESADGVSRKSNHGRKFPPSNSPPSDIFARTIAGAVTRSENPGRVRI